MLDGILEEADCVEAPFVLVDVARLFVDCEEVVFVLVETLLKGKVIVD